MEGRLTRFLLKIANGQTSAYAIRGTWVLPALTVRLVGALIHGDLNGHSSCGRAPRRDL